MRLLVTTIYIVAGIYVMLVFLAWAISNTKKSIKPSEPGHGLLRIIAKLDIKDNLPGMHIQPPRAALRKEAAPTTEHPQENREQKNP